MYASTKGTSMGHLSILIWIKIDYNQNTFTNLTKTCLFLRIQIIKALGIVIRTRDSQIRLSSKSTSLYCYKS